MPSRDPPATDIARLAALFAIVGRRVALSFGAVTFVLVFAVPIERVVRLERAELNRWFMEQTSSPTLVPELGLILAIDHDARLERAFDAVSRGLAVDHDHTYAGDANAKLGPADDIHGDAGQ